VGASVVSRGAEIAAREGGKGACYLRLQGTINEQFGELDFGRLSPIAVLDLSSVNMITSPGVRNWRDFVVRTPDSDKLYLLNAPSCIVNQMNLVVNFCGPAKVISTLTPFYCPKCMKEQEVPIDLLRHAALIGAGGRPPAECPDCGEQMEFEDPGYFDFVPRYAAKAIEPQVLTLLEHMGVYSGHRAEAKSAEVTKLVEGQVTLLKLDGQVDARFRARRLISGLEGAVAVELSSVHLAARGAKRWMEFTDGLAAQCSQAVLIDVPAHAVELNERGSIDFGKVIVHSVLLPCFCSQCGEISTESVRVSRLVTEEQMVATCQRRGHAVELVADAVPLARLKAQHRETPPWLEDVIRRAGALFSAAAVEARLVSDRGSSSSDPANRRQIGAYRIVRPLSEGGMAQIFLANRESLGGFEKPVALKLFRRDLLEVSRTSVDMFLKEARISANLNHPNIVQIFDVGEDAGDLYIAMEYIAGKDVRTIARQYGRALPSAIAAHLGIQVAAALQGAHTARDIAGKPLNIVHRDVSPQNVLVSFDGRVKLIDFGIALAGQQGQKRATSVAGNVSYMSPEQCHGLPVDGRSDVFSLGIVLHELLSGQRLFRRATAEETMEAVALSEVPPLREVPHKLEVVVKRALAKRLDERFQSAGELGEALATAAEELGGPISTPEMSAFVRSLFPHTDETIPPQMVAPLPERTAPSPPPPVAEPTPQPAPVVSSPALAPVYTPEPNAVPPSIITVAGTPAAIRPVDGRGQKTSYWTWVAVMLFVVVLGALVGGLLGAGILK
jgi:serine/threonine-protein kinase